MVIDLESLLPAFDPISLRQMERVSLLNRVDTKYLFPYSLLPVILKQMTEHYHILEVEGTRKNLYETLYFDTDDFYLFQCHQRGKLNRYKFRSRRYVDSGLCFFEIKYKNNKGRTIKERIHRTTFTYQIGDHAADFVQTVSGMDPASLHPKIWVNYSRLTFVSKHSRERVTIDTGISFKNEEKNIISENLVIAEVKQESARVRSRFINLMKKYSIRNKSISKYCLGVINLKPELKNNNFKPILLHLNKLLNAS